MVSERKNEQEGLVSKSSRGRGEFTVKDIRKEWVKRSMERGAGPTQNKKKTGRPGKTGDATPPPPLFLHGMAWPFCARHAQGDLDKLAGRKS